MDGDFPLGDPHGATPTTLKSHILRLLRQAILSGRYPPGSRLNESQLAREFSISRIPIREALMQLQESGLVTNHARRGMFVTRLTDEDVQRINSIRVVLEAEALRLCRANMTKAAAARLSAMVEQMEAWEVGDRPAGATTDFEFHREIWALSGNPYRAHPRLAVHRTLRPRRPGPRRDHQVALEPAPRTSGCGFGPHQRLARGRRDCTPEGLL